MVFPSRKSDAEDLRVLRTWLRENPELGSCQEFNKKKLKF